MGLGTLACEAGIEGEEDVEGVEELDEAELEELEGLDDEEVGMFSVEDAEVELEHEVSSTVLE